MAKTLVRREAARRVEQGIHFRRPAGKRPFSESEFVSGISSEARKRVMKVMGPLKKDAEIVGKSGQGLKGHLIPKNHPRIIGRGTREIIINLGRIRFGGKSYPMVAKILTPRPGEIRGETSGTHHVFVSGDAVARPTELTATFLRQKGFPAPRMYAVPVGGEEKLLWCVVTENLKRKGRKLSEANDFDFGKLRNGKRLKQNLERYVQRMMKLHKERELYANRHITMESPENAFRQCFFVDWSPERKTGRLVMGDLDHVVLLKAMLVERHFQQLSADIEGRSIDVVPSGILG